MVIIWPVKLFLAPSGFNCKLFRDGGSVDSLFIVAPNVCGVLCLALALLWSVERP